MLTNSTKAQDHSDLPAYYQDEILARPQILAPANLLTSDDTSLPPVRRLLVLVPALGTAHDLASRIWQMAVPAKAEVLFLAVTRNRRKEYDLYRYLATLAALTRDDQVHVAIRSEEGKSWIEALRELEQAGDLIVCHAEQSISDWAWRKRELASIISQTLKVPVCVLSGFYPELPPDSPGYARQLFKATVPLGIIIVFSLLQLQIEQLPLNFAYYSLMIFSVLVELSLLFIWNTFFMD
jgi:hypothetical protein